MNDDIELYSNFTYTNRALKNIRPKARGSACLKRSSCGSGEPYIAGSVFAANSPMRAVKTHSLPEEEAVGTGDGLQDLDHYTNYGGEGNCGEEGGSERATTRLRSR